MSHELRIDNGQVSLFYVGGPPWHGLGIPLQNPPTASAAIRAAGLDWEVAKKPLYTMEDVEEQREALLFDPPDPTPLRVADRYAVVPGHKWGKPDCPVFGIVTSAYEPLQNRDAFSFFDPIVAQQFAQYETAGALGKGERIWVLVKVAERIGIVGDDTVDRYLLLSNSHDGESSVQVKFTPIRVVCQNTLTMALSDGAAFRVRHLRGMPAQLADVGEAIRLTLQRFGELEEVFRAMAAVRLDRNRLQEYFAELYPYPNDPRNDYGRQLADTDHAKANYFFENGAGNEAEGVRGTLWAAYNGVAEMVDHTFKYDPTELSRLKHLNAALFGYLASVKAKAFRIAQQKINAWKQ